MDLILKCCLSVFILFWLVGCDDPNGSVKKVHVVYADEKSQVILTSNYTKTSDDDVFEWRQTSGELIEISDVNRKKLVIKTPETAIKLELKFELTVLNSVGYMFTETIIVEVSPYITGLVIDHPLIGATVRLLSLDGLTEHANTITGENGRYRFSNTTDLNEYKVVVEAFSGTIPGGNVFKGEMQAVCINNTERHECNITPISTLVVYHLEKTADIYSKKEAVVQIEQAWSVDLSLDPFVHVIPETNTANRFKAAGIREFLDNGKKIYTWLERMSTHVTRVIEQESISETDQDDINSWIEFKRVAGVPLVAGTASYKTVGGSQYKREATGGNGGVITYTSSDLSVATVDGKGNVTILGAGTAIISASEAQSMNYLAQTDAYTLTVSRGNGAQLSAGADINKTTDDAAFTQAATGGNKGVVTYTSSDTGVATVTNSGLVTLVSSGSVTITASEAQTANYLAQTDAYTLTVSRGNGAQLSAGADINKTTDDAAFTQAATGGNKGVVTYTSSDTGVATVTNSGLVTLVSSGSVIITASEAQTANYLAQTDAYTLTVSRGNGAQLSAGADINKTTDDAAFTQAATGGNKGVVTYTSSDTGVATVTNSGLVTLVSSGSVIITASEAQTANYLAQTDAYTLTVSRGNGAQLSAGADINKTTDDAAFTQAATGGNKGVVTYTSSDTGVATVTNSGLVTLVSSGSVTITASEAQTANHLAQTDAYTLTVSRGNGALLSAGADINKTTDDAAFTQAATGGNKGVVTYTSSDTGVATVTNSGLVTLVSSGSVIITASEAQTANYLAQTDAYTLTVSRGNGAQLSAGADINKTTDDAAFTQAATGGNKGVVTYTSSDTGVATVTNSGLVTLVSSGSVIITASEAQTANYLAQTDAYTLTVSRGNGAQLSAGADINKTTDDAAFTQAATGGNKGVVTYTSSDTGVATVTNSGLVTLVSSGSVIITASEAQTANYLAQTDAYTLTVSRGNGAQLSAGADINKTTDDAAFTQAATGGNKGVVTYTSSDTGVATVTNSGLVTLVSSGSVIITASEAQTANYLAQTDAYTLTVSRGNGAQLSAGADINKTTDDAAFTQAATGGNKGVVTYTSSDTGVATVTNSGLVTLVSSGSVIITASEAQTANYLAQTDAYTLTVSRGNGAQLSAGADINKTTDDAAFTQAATGGNKGVVTYTSSDTGVATVTNSGLVTLFSSGSVTITASEAQTANYLAQTDAYTLTVSRGNGAQLSAGADINKTTDDAAFTQAATGGNKGVVTYTSSDTGVATVTNSGLVTLVSSGSVTITASEAQTANYLAQTDAYTLTVSRGNGAQLSAGADINKTTDDAAFTQAATGGNKGVVTYTSSDTGVATVTNSGLVTLVSSGSVIITASEAQTANYLAQTDAYTLTVSRGNGAQLSAGADINKTTDDAAFTQAATGGNKGVVTYTSSDTGVATVTNSGLVTLVSSGSVIITASEAQTANYLAQTDAYTLTVSRGNGAQLSAGADINKTTDDAAFTQAATGGNKGVVTYTSSDTGVATVTNSGLVTLVSSGSVIITASEAQTANYLAQTDAYTLTVSRGNGAQLSAGADINKTTDDAAFTQAATGGNKGVVTYTSSDTGVATVTNSGLVTLVSSGSVIITASEAQTANYLAQTDAYTLTVSRGNGAQLSAGADINKTTDDAAFTQAATGGNKGVVTYTSSDTGVATVTNSGLVTLFSSGSVTITASEAQTANYLAQTDAYTLTVSRGNGAQLSAGADINKTTDDAAFTQAATGGNKGVVTYTSSDTGVATVTNSGLVTLVSSGSVIITASEAQTANYLAQTDAYTLTVSRGNGAQLSAGADINKTTDDAAFTQAATGGNKGVVTYTSSDTGVATVTNSGLVTLVSSGSVTITASEAQTANYLAQTDAYTLTVSRGNGAQLSAGADINKTTDDAAFTQAATGGNKGVVTYTSSDTGVATVTNSGLVTLVSSGSVIITASEAQTANYLAQTDAYTLTVSRGNGAQLSAGADINKTTDDAAFTQAATGGNKGVVTYTSSDTGVATVTNSGLVTLVSSGSVIITASEAQTANYLAQTDAYTLTVSRGNGAQLSAGADINKTTDDAAFTQAATGGNKGVVTYTSSDTGVATVTNSGLVTLFSSGSVTITASEAQTANYLAQTDAYTLTVSRGNGAQLSAGADINKTTDDAAFTQAATGGNKGVVTYTSSDTGVATVTNSGLVTLVSSGSVIITASEAQTANYLAQTDAYTLTVSRGNGAQLSAGADINKTTDDAAFTQAATGGNKGVVTYTSSDTGVATVTNSGLVTLVSSGSVIITASEAQTANYLAQTDAYTLTVSRGNGAQLSAGADINKTTDDAAFTQAATGGNKGVVTYTSSDTGVATVTNSGLVTLVSSGSVTITASEAQTANYLAQTDAYTLTVSRGNGAQLSAGADINKTTDDAAFTQAATGGNKGVVTYTSSDTGVATVTNSGLVTLVSSGSVIITASEAQTANYLAQTDAYTLTVSRGNGAQLSAGADINKTTDDAAFTQAATGGNKGVVTYTSSDTGVATVTNSGLVTLVSSGSVIITASEAQTANYLAQTDAYTLTVSRGNGAQLSAGADINKTTDDAAFTQAATGGNKGVVTYTSSDTGVATVTNSGLVTLVSSGSVTITASEAQTANYLAQTDAYTLTVSRGNGAQLSAGADINKTTDDAAFTQAATGGNKGVVTYTSSDTGVATVTNSGLVTLVSSGSVIITASEAQTANYLAQTDAYTLTVSRGNGAQLSAGADINKTTDDAAFTQAATGGNKGVVTYTSSDTGVATVTNSGLVTLVSSGSVIITASEAQTANYLAQTDAYTLTVSRGNGAQLSAGADINKTTDDAAFTQAATGGNKGVVTYTSSDTGVATVTNSGLVTLVSSGSVIITASEAQTANYLAQTDAYTLTVSRGNGAQLSAGADINKTTDDAAFTQAATGGNKGVVTYTSSDTGVATVTNSGLVTLFSSGSVTITASEAQTAHYLAQTDAYTLTVSRGNGAVRVVNVYGNGSAFAAIHSDGSVTTWGDQSSGGNSSSVSAKLNGSNPVVNVKGNQRAFAALHSDGSVTTWGHSDSGGDSSSVKDKINCSKCSNPSNPVVSVKGNQRAFAALHSNGSVTTWGASGFGGDSSSVINQLDGSNPVVNVKGNFAYDSGAFAALHSNGSVTTWGASGFGGDSSSVINQLNGDNPVVNVKGNLGAFAALHSDGSVTTWGGIDYGSKSSSAKLDGSNRVVNVKGNQKAFAALHSDGSVKTWGASGFGGDSSSVNVKGKLDGSNPVVNVYGNGSAFAAIHSDGSVTTWGDQSSGGNSESVSAELNGSNPVVNVKGNFFAFAALHSNGSVTTWGQWGGNDSSSVSDKLNGSNPVVIVYGDGTTFAALHSNGSVTTWGELGYSGDRSRLDGSYPVVNVYGNSTAFAALHSDGSVTTWGASGFGGDSSSVKEKLAGSTSHKYDNYDTDRDGISNIDELKCSTPYSEAPENLGDSPCLSAGDADSDSDGVWDYFEKQNGTKPLKGSYLDTIGDANNDGYPDSWVLPSEGINVPVIP